MAWCYEIRRLDNRLVEIRSGFATERVAREAGERSKRTIDCICYPNLETLSLVIKEDGTALSRPPEAPPAPDDKPGLPPAARPEANLKYLWQQAVLDAFLEPHAENVPRKINVAERAISVRLLESDPFELDERIALGEALLALRRLTRERGGVGNESRDKRDKKGIA
jgi:hypothetical protein